MKSRLTSNAIIGMMNDRQLTVIKTLGRKGPIYSFNENMKLIPNDVAERLIGKGILRPREPSEQSFELSPDWRAAP